MPLIRHGTSFILSKSAMYDIKKCQKVEIEQGAFCLGESTQEKNVGYLELKPHTSLTIHNRPGGIENLTQVKGSCVMIIFDKAAERNHFFDKNDKLNITPEGMWHIHSNPFDNTSLTYWHFEGDIRHIINAIKNGLEYNKKCLRNFLLHPTSCTALN